jgi:hypothetical protein
LSKHWYIILTRTMVGNVQISDSIFFREAVREHHQWAEGGSISQSTGSYSERTK